MSDIKNQGEPIPPPANDNGGAKAPSLDPRIRCIAEAIGHHMAREHIKELRAANDNA